MMLTVIGPPASLSHAAVGAPLVYADQAWSIGKRRNSEGFSKDVCGVLLIANIARCFWWFHEHFEFALLLQSLLMIVAQLGLLSLVLRYQPGSYASSAYTSSYEDYARGNPAAPTPARPQQQQQQPPTPTPTPVQVTVEQPSTSHSAPSTNPAFDSLFSTVSGDGGASRKGINIPYLGNVSLPALPLLDDSRGAYASTSASAPAGAAEEEEYDDTDPVSLPTRAARQFKSRTARFLHRLAPLVGIRNDGSTRLDGSSAARPLGFWTWRTLSSYLIFLILYASLLATLQVVFNSSTTYNSILSFFSLGLESSLPLPQFISNQSRRSLAGFRISVLLGWLFGDGFKTVYFIVKGSPLPFLIGGIFALTIDLAIVAQWKMFEEKTRQDEEQERLVAEETTRRQAGDRRSGDAPQTASTPRTATAPAPPPPRISITRPPRESSFDEDLEDAQPILFDSEHVSGVRTSKDSSRMFTIEADED